MLINITNHPSSNWSAEQLRSADVYGGVTDLPFPSVDPSGDADYFSSLADEYTGKVLAIPGDNAVLVQGEFVLTYRLVNRLKQKGIKCLAAETKRNTVETVDGNGNTIRTSVFKFEQFMEY